MEFEWFVPKTGLSAVLEELRTRSQRRALHRILPRTMYQYINSLFLRSRLLLLKASVLVRCYPRLIQFFFFVCKPILQYYYTTAVRTRYVCTGWGSIIGVAGAVDGFGDVAFRCGLDPFRTACPVLGTNYLQSDRIVPTTELRF